MTEPHLLRVSRLFDEATLPCTLCGGKSTYALELAEEISTDRSFLATGPVMDGERRQRSEKHRREREGRGWRCCEEEISIAARIAEIATEGVILVDCLTLWLTNWRMPGTADKSQYVGAGAVERSAQVKEEPAQRAGDTEQNALPTRPLALVKHAQIAMLLGAIDATPGPLVLVGNEIGLGVIPMGAEVRAFVDALGRLNQDVAQHCQRVTLMAAGLPLTLKDSV